MPIINRIAAFHDEMTAWRRDLHAHPELGYRETRTSRLIAEHLRAFGVDEVHDGIAETGVVGVIRGRLGGGDGIGLRADIDALPIEEATGLPHASTYPGRMHACGHDGHTAMLLGASKYLAETRDFGGTAYVIFQPAEEGGAGGLRMVKEGLFERFPMRAVFGMHNWPDLPIGAFAARAGPMMAAVDTFAITLAGRGGHAAMPYDTVDPIPAAAALVQALQTVVARNVRAVDPAVVSVTRVHAGDAFNVVPETASLWGTVRTYAPEVRSLIRGRIEAIAAGVGGAHGVEVEVAYRIGYPPTVNDEHETAFALDVAAEVAGADSVERDIEPSMGGEDFSYLLQERPGCYIRVGNGPAEDGRRLHGPRYDFDDRALPFGASYWCRLVERALPAA